MPANQKYLTASPWQRAGKISAAIVGGYMVSMALHIALAAWFDHVNVIITATFSGFILWAGLMIIAFLSRSAMKIWLIYLLLSIALTALAFLGKWYNPHFMH